MTDRPETPETVPFWRSVREFNWTGFVLLNFAAPIAFFVVFEIWGAKPAISVAVLSTLIQVVAHRVGRIAFSPFFIVASGFTVGFGMIDLFISTPRFYRFEPGVENVILGGVFLITAITRRPLVAWFASALPEMVRPRIDESVRGYLRKVTVAWAIYFWIKAAIYFYVAVKVDLGKLVLFRSTFGGATLGLMLGGEIAYRRLFLSASPEPRR